VARITAREKGVAAFVVLHDSALVDLCVVKTNELAGTPPRLRLRDKRVEMYGKEILDALRRFHEG